MKFYKILSVAAAVSMLAGLSYSAYADEAVDSEASAEQTISDELSDKNNDEQEPDPEQDEEKNENNDSAEQVGEEGSPEDNKNKPEYSFRVTADGKAIITDVTTDKTSFTIPETVDNNGAVIKVTGVEDFSFAMCENLTTIFVPAGLTLEDTGNAAFITEKAFIKFMDGELGDAATFDDVLRYIAKKANFKDGNFTEEDLAELSVKLYQKLSTVDISKAETVEAKIMTIVRNINKMDLNPNLRDSFGIWIATVTYDGLTLCGLPGIPMQEYAEGRKILGMNYISQTDYIVGDANGDGKVNVRDSAFIASMLSKGGIDIGSNPAADFNLDGKVTVRDAAALARALAEGTINKA